MPLAQHQLSVGAALGRRIAAGAVVAGLGLALWVPAAVAQDRPAPNPEVLTERFPLDAVETAPRSPAPPATSEPAAPSSREATPPAPAPAADGSSGDSTTLVLIIAAAFLLAGALVGGRALRRRWLRNSEPPIPPWRGSRPAPDGRAGVAAMEARVRPRRGDPGLDAVNARISPPEAPPVSEPDITPTARPARPRPPPAPAGARRARLRRPRREPVAEPPPAPPPAAEAPRPEPAPPPPPPDITLVEAAPGAPAPRPRVHDDDAAPPLPDITLIDTPNGAGGRHDPLPGLGDDLEPSAPPSLDELPDITLVEPPPPAAAPPSAAPRPRRDPGSDALAARIRPDEAQLDATARALRSRVPPREEPQSPDEFWSARRRAQTELQAAAAAAGEAARRPRRPRTRPEPRARPSLPASVREIATPRHPPAAATVPVAVIHGFRSALRALRSGPREEERTATSRPRLSELRKDRRSGAPSVVAEEGLEPPTRGL